MSSDIVLIGPQGSGKSTVSALLLNRLDLPRLRCIQKAKRQRKLVMIF